MRSRWLGARRRIQFESTTINPSASTSNPKEAQESSKPDYSQPGSPHQDRKFAAKESDEEEPDDEPVDSFGHKRLGGIGDRLAKLIEKETGFETRATILGHIQRGGSPTAFDRVLATRFGVKAAQLVNDKKFGRMVSLTGSKLTDVAIEEATGTLKTLDMELYSVAEVFFG